MDDLAGTEWLEQGREAAARSDWPQAYDLLVRADQVTRLSLEDLGLLAQVAYASGHLEATIEAWERVHTQAHQAGDSPRGGGRGVPGRAAPADGYRVDGAGPWLGEAS